MLKTEDSKEYEAWLEEQRILANNGDERAEARVATANHLKQTRMTRETRIAQTG